MCEYQSLTANEFAGPPKLLPPLLTGGQRFDAYMEAVGMDADAEQLMRVFADVGQRLAKVLKSDPNPERK